MLGDLVHGRMLTVLALCIPVLACELPPRINLMTDYETIRLVDVEYSERFTTAEFAEIKEGLGLNQSDTWESTWEPPVLTISDVRGRTCFKLHIREVPGGATVERTQVASDLVSTNVGRIAWVERILPWLVRGHLSGDYVPSPDFSDFE